MPTEFELIARHFARATPSATLGIGDDAALLNPAGGMELVVSTDMLVAGIHFSRDTPAEMVGSKAMAVNLSDMAAMGATPRWALLAIALPQADEGWLSAFSSGLYGMAETYGVEVVGGDTTRGPLNICMTIMGEVRAGAALRRDGAKVGDEIWVSGQLGAAALALSHQQGTVTLDRDEAAYCLSNLQKPRPRVALGRGLVGVAHAAIDISDGLLADLGHILERSGVGAELMLNVLPAAPPVRVRLPEPVSMACLLAGGDDYELCFTAPADRRREILQTGERAGVELASVGRIVEGTGVRVLGPDGRPMQIPGRGYDHFA